jgi:hypothetical protein
MDGVQSKIIMENNMRFLGEEMHLLPSFENGNHFPSI